MISKKKIEEAVNIIARNYTPEKIILFGSYADGTPAEDSDVDFLVIKDTVTLRRRRAREIRKDLRMLTVPMDILVYKNSIIFINCDV